MYPPPPKLLVCLFVLDFNVNFSTDADVSSDGATDLYSGGTGLNDGRVPLLRSRSLSNNVQIIQPIDAVWSEILNCYYYYYYYYYYYLLQLSCHSEAVVLTPVQTKQIRINIHKQNNTKTQYKQYKNTVNTST